MNKNTKDGNVYIVRHVHGMVNGSIYGVYAERQDAEEVALDMSKLIQVRSPGSREYYEVQRYKIY